MGRITRKAAQLHDQALQLIHSDRRLTLDEIELVYRQYNPLANQNVTVAGIFFTPYDLAFDFAGQAAGWDGASCLDLAAGIGVLSHAMWCTKQGHIKRLVCVELNPEFVTIGRRLLPEAEWIQASIFNEDVLRALGTFDIGYANPPFGKLPSTVNTPAWLHKGPAHLQTVELLLRLCQYSHVIMPTVDCWDLRVREPKKSQNYERLVNLFPGLQLLPDSIECRLYADQWQGVAPNVTSVEIVVEELWQRTPLGLPPLPQASVPLAVTTPLFA